MAELNILIDTSTRPVKREGSASKYGKSTACWVAYWESSVDYPFRIGVIYRDREGPNKMFYIGIVEALYDCLELIRERSADVIIKGDNQLVIKQLKEEWSVNELEPYYEDVKSLEYYYDLSVDYVYVNDQDSNYKKVDECAKQFINIVKTKYSRI